MTFLDPLLKLSERTWAKQVDQLAEMFGWGMWRDNATNAPRRCPRCQEPIRLPRNAPGWPDRIYIRDDTLLVVELKSDRGSTTPEQEAWLTAFRRVAKVVVKVWRPKNLDEVTRMLR